MSPAGTPSDVGPIARLALMHARDAFGSQQAVDRQWRGLGYGSPPRYDAAVAEYDRFLEALGGFGLDIDLRFLPPSDRATLDAMYVRDASVASPRGVVLAKMGKAARAAEPDVHYAAFRGWGIPVAGAITGEGCLEGGDVVWLGPRTVAVGRGYRTNDEGIRQLRDLLHGDVDELIVVHLPHWKGPADVFHLMSVVSPIDVDLALVYSPLLPVSFRERLRDRGVALVEVPDDEFESMGCNVLAVAPRRCLMLAGNPSTRARLEAAGAEVREYVGSEISAKGAGGPTCLTRPL